MAKLIIRRLLLGLVTMWVVSLMVFGTTEVLPGDVATAILGQSATPEALTAIRQELGLDRPALIRYIEWLGNLVTGDLGKSLATGRQITELIGERLGKTLILAMMTAALAVPLAISLGLIAAIFPGSFFDRGICMGTLCLVSVPEFFTASLLVLIFAVTLHWLPAISYITADQSLLKLLRNLTLPIMTLTASIMAHMTRMTRTAVLNVVSSSYIEMAILKGVPRLQIVLRHALLNALAPIFNVVALNLAYLISGVVIVETVFAYPGIAKLMVDAVSTRDIPLVQACAMMFCCTYVGLNLLADLFSILTNPRLRFPK
jgi:peptide/nickel transport system permease protein